MRRFVFREKGQYHHEYINAYDIKMGNPLKQIKLKREELNLLVRLGDEGPCEEGILTIQLDCHPHRRSPGG